MPLSRRPAALPGLVAALLIVLTTFLAASAAPLRAEERITSYDSTIRIARDGTLEVTETIVADAEGRDIKRGIYRDFPLVFEDADGQRHKVGFKLLSVRRDGAQEPYKENWSSDGVRIYIGDPNAILAHRSHTFQITYETTRQIRFFDNHDELYWNVTGQEWRFPIEHASARVVLPEGVTATKWQAFTGRFGATGTDWTAEAKRNGGAIVFSTTRALQMGEGFSIAVAMPKGTIAQPTVAQEAAYLLLDHHSEIVAFGGLAVVLAYFVWAWLRVGRDPPKGTIIPLFEAPEGVSPALADYILNRGFSGAGWRALSAACIDLAVKGYLELDDLRSRITLRPTRKSDGIAALPPGEAAVLTALGGEPLQLSKKNGSSVASLGSKFRGAITSENRSRFFKSNTAHWLPGLGLSLSALVALVLFGDLGEQDIFLLGVVTIFVTFFTIIIVRVGLDVIRTRSLSGAVHFILFGSMIVIFMGAIGLQVLSIALTTGGAPLVVVTIVALLWVNILFYYLMGAPTAHGRLLMDRLEGLKLYLSVAERDRLNMNGAPEMSPTRFETLLPYAVALEVEKPWSEAFQNWLETATAAKESGMTAAYVPAWYHGRRFAPQDFGNAMSATVDAMSNSFTTSLPTPKSSSSGFSSGGGGGGVGGGGGGGGGGGW